MFSRRHFVISAFALSAFASGAAHADQLADIKEKGEIVFGVLGTDEPNSFIEPKTRQLVGYEIDLAAAVAKKLGVKPVFKQMAVSARIPELQQGHVDILAATLTHNKEREAQVDFALTHFVTGSKVMVRAAGGVKELGQLAGKKVVTVRGVPLLLVVFWVYFFLPAVTGVKTGQATTMLMVLVLFDAIYLAEIVAAGIRVLPKGQLEGARSLGLGYGQALRHVVLPQTVRNGLPSLVSQLVSTIKATSLGYIIGLSEVSFIATQVNTLVFTQAVEVYLILALSYFVLCFGLSRLAFLLERRLQRRPLRSS